MTRLSILPLALLVACGRGDPAPEAELGTVAARVLPRVASAPLAANTGGVATLQLDVERSVIRWKGTKFRGLGKHEGIVRLASGAVTVDGRAPRGGSIVVDMRSIEVTDNGSCRCRAVVIIGIELLHIIQGYGLVSAELFIHRLYIHHMVFREGGDGAL